MSDSLDRTKSLFAAALALPPGQREAFLIAECVGDEALLARVRELVQAHERAGSFLAEPGADVRRAAAAADAGEQAGEVVGAYKLLERIGEGGFGTVWMAEQKEPVRRLVALKVLKPGMDSKQVVARFEQERQALALMQHPNVAQVFDAGTTPRGRPFFVMELVKGVPITDYCAREKLPVRARLSLFVQVCRAVQHAHGKGVIHRDIKPRNVLVATADGKPLAKVIDFGIAKATGARLTEATLWTEHRAMIGTLEYMSPEQAEGLLDVDTRSDVYSLGALLYELLTGSTPFDAKELVAAGYGEILRTLREVEPQRPSLRVSTGAGWVGGAGAASREAKDLFGVLKGDLDWVVLKALEKDRARRYASADGLAEDVERYLGGEAVQAVPPSVGYRLRKFARKNRALVGGVAAVLLTLGGGIIATSWSMQRERALAMQASSLAIGAVGMIEDLKDWDKPMLGFVERDASSDMVGDATESIESVKATLSYLGGTIQTMRSSIRSQIEFERVQTYRAHLGSCIANARAQLPSLAATSLDRCREGLREWEWKHARVVLADGLRMLSANERAWIMCRDGERFAYLEGTRLVVARAGTWAIEGEMQVGFLDPSRSCTLHFPSHHRLVVETNSVLWVLDPIAGTARSGLDLSAAAPGSRIRCWSRDATRVAAEDDKTVTVWDVDSGARLCSFENEWCAYVSSFSHDARFVAQVRSDKLNPSPKTRVWRIADGTCVCGTKGTLSLNPFGPRSVSSEGEVVDLPSCKIDVLPELADAVFEYCDSDLVVRTAKGIVPVIGGVLREFATPEVRSLMDGRITDLPGNRLRIDAGLSMTPDLTRSFGCYGDSFFSSTCLATEQDLDIPVWSWLTCSGDGKWWLGNGLGNGLIAMAARPPATAAASSHPVLALASVPTVEGPATRSRSASHSRTFDEYTGGTVETEVPATGAVAGSQDGRRFVLWSSREIFVEDAASSQRVATLSTEADDVLAVAISHDGARVAACDATRVRVWDVTASKVVCEVPLSTQPASAPTLAVSGDHLALGTEGSVRLFTIGESAHEVQQALAGDSATSLLFCPDGTQLLVGTASGRVTIRTVPGLSLSASLTGHMGAVRGLAWSQDGNRAFTAGSDGTVRIWHPRPFLYDFERAAVELLSLSEPDIVGKPTCLLYPPDGERLICGYDDGAIRVWDSVPWSERVDRRNAAMQK